VKWSLPIAEKVLNEFNIVSVIDANGYYIYANQLWLDNYKITKDELTKISVWDVVPDSAVNEVYKTKRPYLGKIIKGTHGETAYTSYFPLMENNKLIGILTLSQNTQSENTEKLVKMVTQLQNQLEDARQKLNLISSSNYSISQIAGHSVAIQQLKNSIINSAKTNSTVLIEGETGVGKELVANAIHDLSNRRDKRLLCVNCSAIPEALMESEFFGYEDGTFTGAKRGGKIGKFELANGGTLFLDEINALPIHMQPKFLRVIQEHEVERLGGKNSIPLDIRYIAASNQNLENLVASNQFRIDLFYRLNVVIIIIPPLRDRKEDIPDICKQLLIKLNDQLKMSISYIEHEVYELLYKYDWPGNIRELQNVLERAMNRANGDSISCQDILLTSSFIQGKSNYNGPGSRNFIRQQVAQSEKEILFSTLAETNNNRSAAAKLLGISRTALYNKLHKYSIK